MRITTQRCIGAGLAAALLLASGCASMSKEECLALDWRTLGYEDGVAGRPGGYIAHHRQACDDYGVKADLDTYQQGRTQGLLEYCRPGNGFRVGAHGGDYAGVCPVEIEGGFLDAFNVGRQLHELESRLSSADAQLGAKRRELEALQHSVAATAVAVATDETSTGEERAQAVLSAAERAERIGRLKGEIKALEQDRARYERDLDEYRARMPAIA